MYFWREMRRTDRPQPACAPHLPPEIREGSTAAGCEPLYDIRQQDLVHSILHTIDSEGRHPYTYSKPV